jgi:hypothetical protein
MTFLFFIHFYVHFKVVDVNNFEMDNETVDLHYSIVMIILIYNAVNNL